MLHPQGASRRLKLAPSGQIDVQPQSGCSGVSSGPRATKPITSSAISAMAIGERTNSCVTAPLLAASPAVLIPSTQ